MAGMTTPTPRPPTTPADRDDPIGLAATLRPQEFGRERAVRIRQPVVEPLWLGVRVIAGATGDRAAIFEDGAALPGQSKVEEALAATVAVTAGGLILDGYLTGQPEPSDLPPSIGTDEIPSVGQLLLKPLMGIRRDRAGERLRRLEAEAAARTFREDDTVVLVATDLLWLDGQWLLDVPLLERKRLLESVVPGVELVRCGPYVQPPIATWLGSWRVQGFTGMSYKEANSRYRPGERTSEWIAADLPRR